MLSNGLLLRSTGLLIHSNKLLLLLDFSLTVKAAPHASVKRTGQP